jgi:hypothetical protein
MLLLTNNDVVYLQIYLGRVWRMNVASFVYADDGTYAEYNHILEKKSVW